MTRDASLRLPHQRLLQRTLVKGPSDVCEETTFQCVNGEGLVLSL